METNNKNYQLPIIHCEVNLYHGFTFLSIEMDKSLNPNTCYEGRNKTFEDCAASSKSGSYPIFTNYLIGSDPNANCHQKHCLIDLFTPKFKVWSCDQTFSNSCSFIYLYRYLQ